MQITNYIMKNALNYHGYYKKMYKENIVSIIKWEAKYPNTPYNPNKKFEEFYGFHKYNFTIDDKNHIYEMVRNCFIELELDKENIGTIKWSPFKELVKKWDNVVIKPNLVYHSHPLGKEWVLSMISNASIIRPIIDYIILATEWDVKITICDVPLQSANWEEIIKNSWIKDLVDFYTSKNININLIDLRLEISKQNKEWIIISRDKKIRDPLWYTAVDLWNESALMPIIKFHNKFEITDYWSWTVPKHHNFEKNEYYIPNTILNSDLFINIPKFKTHRKAWITFWLKNIIWINWDKSWLAHHRKWSIKDWWDEYDKLTLNSLLRTNLIWYLKQNKFWIFIVKILYWIYRLIVLKGKEPKKVYMEWNNKPITEWSWYWNDTIWRCIKDLNNIIFFADKKWNITKKQQRKYLIIWDWILWWDKEWPMEQTPKYPWLIIWWFNPVYTDSIAATIMWFNYKKIPQIYESFKNENFKLCEYNYDEIEWKSNIDNIKSLNLNFTPSVNWKKHIEK